MKIALLTSGRFHLCDLARELAGNGHDVKFYSCVPPSTKRIIGLRPENDSNFLLPLAPLLYAARRANKLIGEVYLEKLFVQSFNTLAAKIVQPCDIIITLSGLASEAAAKIRHKYGARVWIERGSTHILEQRRILKGINSWVDSGLNEYKVQRELHDYEIADTIVVPSRNVEKSFIDRGISQSKLFRNPYGADLKMFPKVGRKGDARPTVLFVGTWSLRKGCDVLWEACARAGSWRLIHVGDIGDAPLPRSPLFFHHDPVKQWRLRDYFAEADVFAIASREEGLALVQAQALACGLPLVCTDRTGGADLVELLGGQGAIYVVPPNDIASLQIAITNALGDRLSNNQRNASQEIDRELLSWRRYGQRYSLELTARA